MRTSEQRVEELHRRMDNLKKERSSRRYKLQCAAAFAACLAITVAMALIIAGTPFQSPAAGSDSISASIFANNTALGYVVVALLAFCLGALVTVFCFRLRKHREENRDVDRDR